MYDHNPGGGKSQNTQASKKATHPKVKDGAPKLTNDGKDLSPDATNTIGEKFSNKMLSPGPAARKHW